MFYTPVPLVFIQVKIQANKKSGQTVKIGLQKIIVKKEFAKQLKYRNNCGTVK